ncbi:MAG: hypothetical protein JXA24_03385 [Proteobacteria bacterium]|nr:hypothetical protein [Pseudomonadota bacterium]
MVRTDLNPTFQRPVTAQTHAPESAGHLLPEKSYPQIDPVLNEARSMLASLAEPGVFQINATLRTRDSRPFGAFPDDGPKLPVGHVLGVLIDSVSSAHASLAAGRRASSTKALGQALEALHSLGRDADLLAPLHAWLPEEASQEALSRLSFSLAELATEEPQQRKVQHYLDLLIEELPDPLAGAATTPRQRLLRMLAHIYMGRSLNRSRTVQEAIKQYETALRINDLHQPGIEGARFRAYAELIELRFMRTAKLLSEVKFSRALAEVKEIVRLRGEVESRLPLDKPEYRDAMIAMRQEIGRRLWGLGLVSMAYGELRGIQEEHASALGKETLEEIISASPLSEKRKARLARHFIDESGSLKPIDELGDLSLGTRAWIWLTHTLKNARRRKPFNTFMTWAGGAAGAAGAVYAASCGEASFQDLLAASGAGAAIFDGATRLYNGAVASETGEAREIGLDDIGPAAAISNTAAFAGKSLLPYVIFGGQLPGLGAISEAPVIGRMIEAAPESMVAAGSLEGLGSIVSGAISALSSEAGAAVSALGASGAAGYASHFSQTTLGSTLVAAIDTYRDAVSSVFDGSLFARAGRAASDLAGANGWQQGLAAYQAASLGYYAASRFSPSFRRSFNTIGPAFVPGGLLLAANIGAALGADPGYVTAGPVTLPLNLIGTAAVGAGYQILGQTLIGNRGFKEIQWYNVLGAAGVINLYVGTSTNFAPLQKSESFSQMVAESVGRQIGMLPIIATHGAALMVNPHRFLQNKAARLLAYDHAGNLIRIASGHWDGFLPVLAGVSVGFLVTNSLLGCTFNDLAGSKPAAQSFRSMLANAGGEASPGVMRAMARSLRRVPPAAAVTKMSLDTLTLPTRVFVNSLRGKRLAPYMLPEENTYAMMHDAVMADPKEDGLTDLQMKTLLDATGKFLARPEDADVARGLMVTLSAAKGGPHAEKIARFFEQNRDVHARLRVDRRPIELPAERAAKKEALYALLKHPYRVCPGAMAPARQFGLGPKFAQGFAANAPLLSGAAMPFISSMLK